MNGAIVAKTIIVLGAFPVIVHATFTVVTWVLGLMLPQIVPMAGSWSEAVRMAAAVGTFLLAVRVAFGLCRRMWPTPAVK